jgi:16S rRNA (adenine1518-N6/adenine1519-N6)-dimethyltransferase
MERSVQTIGLVNGPLARTERGHSRRKSVPFAGERPLAGEKDEVAETRPAGRSGARLRSGSGPPEAGQVALLGPADIRGLADRLGLRPTKRLGQNFVHDANTVRRIARLAEPRPDDVVLEIGPGLGSLTLALLPAAAAVLAVEIDPVLAEALPATVAARAPGLADRLTVLTLDALALTAARLPVPPTAVVANLPYNVAVPVLLRVLAELPSVRHGLVMIQSEVVDRLAAAPGSREYGAPSAKLAWYAAARRVGPVPRTVFWPVPGVDSALLAVQRRPTPEASPATRAEVFALVDAAFAQRRKSLRAALAGWAGSAEAAERVLRAAGVDPGTRAERLGIADFTRIAAIRPR